MKQWFLVIGVLLSATIISFSQIPTDGLIGYWPFNGNANDESGNNHHGTIHGVIPAEDRTGKPNSAYFFDGVNDYIYITNSSLVSGDQLTLSCWVKSEDEDAGWLIMTGNQNDYDLGVNGDSITGWIIAGGQGRNLGKSYFDKSIWNHLLLRYTGSALELFCNGDMVNSIPASGNISSPQSDHLTFGVYTLSGNPYSGFYKGVLDDIRIYNIAVTDEELVSLAAEGLCSDITLNDTTEYLVSSLEFEDISPWVNFDSTQTLLQSNGVCDSVVNHYSAFVFDPSYCSDTITTVIFDTTYVTIQDTITTHVTDTTFVTVADSTTVTDTLVIDAVLTDIAPPYNINTLKVYPNPARDHLFIHTGNYGMMAWYRLKIINDLGVTVFETIVEEPLYELKLSEWTGLGLYFLQLIDPGGEMIEVRKIVLE